MTPARDLGVPASVRSVLVFGGSFDPPHRAHVELPPLARDALGLDWLLYIPAARSPHKSTGPIAPMPDRVVMLGLALQGRARTSVTDIEQALAAHDGASYTIDTLEHVRAALGEGVMLRLLIGADQARAFHRWKSAETILRIAPPAVMLRPPDDDRDRLLAELAKQWGDEDMRTWRSAMIELPTIEMDSTQLRSRLRDGVTGRPADTPQDDTTGSAGLTPEVAGYIAERGLYREP